MRLFFLVIIMTQVGVVRAESHDVTIRHAPYVVHSVTSKSEFGHAPCKYCGATISYERKFKRKANSSEWVETSQAPTVCRKCEKKLKDQEKLDRQERDLDRKIDYERSKQRISAKKETLQNLRKSNR